MVSVQKSKKKVSKKLKSSWRKHVDINDVEEFLEDKRFEERLGPPLSLLPDNELFKLDTVPNLELLSAKERRKLKVNKPLKCFWALQPHTKVPDPISKRNRVRTKEERQNELVKRKELLNKAKGIFKARDVLADENRKLAEIQKNSKPKRGEFNNDLWDNESNTQYDILKDEWTSKNTKKHNLRGVGIPVKNARKSVMEKESPLPAIEIPHPGMSYNPSYKDHQELLRIVGEKEMKLIKTEEHLTRCTRGMFQKVTEEQRDKSWLVEMSEGLPSKDGTNTEENEAENDYSSINPPVQNRKKTMKQKRKQKEQLQLEKARRVLKLEKKKITDIHQLKILSKKLEAIEKKQSILRERRKKKAELKKREPKVLGSIKFEDPDLEFNVAKDIAGNLKNLKTEGYLLVDRFKSMQKRNIVAPSKKHTAKKAKVKKYTKPGHKDEDWKKTVARSI